VFVTTQWLTVLTAAHSETPSAHAALENLCQTYWYPLYGHEPVDNRTPETGYERHWALTLLETVLQRLRAEYEQAGKVEWFDCLNSSLAGPRETQPYADLAARLGASEGAVKVAVHRLRKRYRQLLRAEIAATLTETEDVDEELRHLFAVLADG
jgi:hypothetical protein